MEKYITIPSTKLNKPDVFIRVSKIFSAKKNNNESLRIIYVDKASQSTINHAADQGFEMIEWLIANILRANDSKSAVTKATKPPFNITGFSGL